MAAEVPMHVATAQTAKADHTIKLEGGGERSMIAPTALGITDANAPTLAPIAKKPCCLAFDSSYSKSMVRAQN